MSRNAHRNDLAVRRHPGRASTRLTGLWTGLLAALLMACGGGGASTGVATGSPTGTPTGTPGGGTSTPVTRILWIGNSYTYVNDLPALLTALSTTAGRSPLPSITTVLDGGQSLKGAAGRADISTVMARGWDIVVLQEQSTTPITAPDTMLRYGTQLGEMAKRAGAKVLLFQTWPPGDATPSATAIRAAYDQLARAIGATVVPVGDAWLQMMTARPDLALYQDDGSHPTAIGTYLAACVFHNLLHNQSAIGLPRESYSVRTNRYAGGLVEPIVKIPLDAAVALAAQQAADRATGR
jgi:hypothetical protein